MEKQTDITSCGKAIKHLRELRIEQLRPNRLQPRKAFGEAQILSLAESIRAGGGARQPIVVRLNSSPERSIPWEIVAGGRRWRAYQRQGRATVPCIIREMDDTASMQALPETCYRQDLNQLKRAIGQMRRQDTRRRSRGKLRASR